jgi:Pyridoxamine 5'-phosphate oxidase
VNRRVSGLPAGGEHSPPVGSEGATGRWLLASWRGSLHVTREARVSEESCGSSVAILHPEVQLNSSEDLDKNRRKLTEDECLALLRRPLTGVFSTISTSGWIHSVPVHFDFVDDEVKVLAEADAVRTRNAERTGHATFCVETTDGPVRSYVSISGPVTVRRPPTAEDLISLDARYSRTDFSSGWDDASFATAVMLVLHPRRWIAWCDWD